jgi:hypothetical protein
MDIKNNRLIQSNHYLLVRMQQEQGGKIVTDDLVFKIQLSLPNPQRFDMDIDTSFWANSLPENVFRFRFK